MVSHLSDVRTLRFFPFRSAQRSPSSTDASKDVAVRKGEGEPATACRTPSVFVVHSLPVCRDVVVHPWQRSAGKRVRRVDFTAKPQDQGRFKKGNLECEQIQSGCLHVDGFVLHITQACSGL